MTSLLNALPRKPVDATNVAARDLLQERLNGFRSSTITLTAKVTGKLSESGTGYGVVVELIEGSKARSVPPFVTVTDPGGQQHTGPLFSENAHDVLMLNAAGAYWCVSLELAFPRSQAEKLAGLKDGDILKVTGTVGGLRVNSTDTEAYTSKAYTYKDKVLCHQLHMLVTVSEWGQQP